MLANHLLRTKERIQKFKETRDTNHIYWNELGKGCFQHDMSYGDFKDLAKRIGSDKILRVKTFNTAKILKYDEDQRGLASMVYKFFDKNSKGGGANNEIKQKKKLAEELHKPIIKKILKSLFFI